MPLELPPVLASIDAMRPVFLILMGLSLLLVAWRLTRGHRGWPARTMLAGAVLLALGYGLILPLYELQLIPPPQFLPYLPHVDPSVVFAWHIAKLFAMNGGWLFFGLGLALHARAFEALSPAPTRIPS